MSTEPLLQLFLLQALGLAGVVAAAGQQPCAHHMSVSLANGTTAKDGSVHLDGMSFPLESQFELNGELRGCPCLLRNCIRRCCAPGKFLDKLGCHEPDKLNNSTYEFDVPQLPKDIFHPEIKDYEEHFYILYNNQCFTGKFIAYSLNKFLFFISPNGTLQVKKKGNDKPFRTVTNELYCVAYSEKLRTETFASCRTEGEILQKSADRAIRWSFAIGSWLSAIFLIMTFAVYVMFSSLRNLHGQILMVYVACLIVAYIFSPLINQEYFVKIFSEDFCTVAGLPFVPAPADSLSSHEIQSECPEAALVDLTDAFRGGPLSVNGTFYPADAISWRNGRALGCPCRTRACLPLCCRKELCLSSVNATGFFPLYDPKSLQLDREAKLEDFYFVSFDPCDGADSYILEPETNVDDEFLLLSNGSIYANNINELIRYKNYCISSMEKVYKVMMCFESRAEENKPFDTVHLIFPIGMLISVPFLLATIIVYLLIPELRNIHGQTLCAYVFCLIVAYVVLATLQITAQDQISDLSCVCFAYIVHFSFLASFFWLNVMCFDIWWTFGGFRSLHGSVKQRERKKFIIYSIYAWGCASLITIICMIMDLVPGIPETFIRPEFGKQSCWFRSDIARAIYFYVPMGVTVFCNICLFILTALKILRHKKDTARQLKGSDSRRHDDNKQWFNLYLKLFIVMGINWSMEIISWIFEKHGLPKYVWYITDLTNTLQGVIIFVIFVWKDKIKRLLMKRFGCQGGNFLSRNSTRSGCPTSSTSRATCITSAPLQEKSNPYVANPTFRSKSNVTDESDCI